MTAVIIAVGEGSMRLEDVDRMLKKPEKSYL